MFELIFQDSMAPSVLHVVAMTGVLVCTKQASDRIDRKAGKRIRNLAKVVIATALAAAPVWATEEVSDDEKFQLWNNCGPVDLVVENLSNDAKSIGLTEKRIRTTVESRLRGARIYSGDAYNVLYVRVGVVGQGFHIETGFNIWISRTTIANTAKITEVSLQDLEFIEYSGVAQTWGKGITGTHGDDAGFILQAVAELSDEFINEYLRVNAEACL